jgi:hypothetical protein
MIESLPPSTASMAPHMLLHELGVPHHDGAGGQNGR